MSTAQYEPDMEKTDDITIEIDGMQQVVQPNTVIEFSADHTGLYEIKTVMSYIDNANIVLEVR
jgi:hypothetical protein